MSLATSYLGLSLQNPLVASASPLNSSLDNIRRLEDAGAAAVVLPSLFQEQIEAMAETQASRVDVWGDSSPEAGSYFPAAASGPYGVGPERYLDLVRRGAEAVSIPVIASLNGSSRAGWIDYASQIEHAGAAALELNMYHVPTDPSESGRDVEARYTDIVQAVCESVTLPVAVKLTPFLSSVGHMATTLVEQGAAGLVLFNRLLTPDIDLSRMKLTDQLTLSDADETRLPMLWISILAGRTKASLAASGGVSSTTDVVKYLLAGADVVMTTAALLRHDIEYMTALVSGLQRWMEAREIASLTDLRGMMRWRHGRDHETYTRANYLRILEGYGTPEHQSDGEPIHCPGRPCIARRVQGAIGPSALRTCRRHARPALIQSSPRNVPDPRRVARSCQSGTARPTSQAIDNRRQADRDRGLTDNTPRAYGPAPISQVRKDGVLVAVRLAKTCLNVSISYPQETPG